MASNYIDLDLDNDDMDMPNYFTTNNDPRPGRRQPFVDNQWLEVPPFALSMLNVSNNDPRPGRREFRDVELEVPPFAATTGGVRMDRLLDRNDVEFDVELDRMLRPRELIPSALCLDPNSRFYDEDLANFVHSLPSFSKMEVDKVNL